MTDNTKMAEESAQSNTIAVEKVFVRCRQHQTGKGVQQVTYELDNYEVVRLIEQMLRGEVDSVDAREVANKLRTRQE